MIKKELAKIFYEIAAFLEIKEEDFKPRAYRRAASSLESMEGSLEDIYNGGGVDALQKIPGIGKSIALKIEEYIRTGKVKEHEKLKKETPVEMKEMTKIEGVGPKTVKTLYKELGVKNIKELEKAAKEKKISPLFGFDEKTEKNILEGIDFLKKTKSRFPLGEISFRAKEVQKELEKLSEVKKINVAGSLRRMKETVGDVDFLIVSDDPEKVMEYFVSLPGVLKVWGKGSTKASVRTAEGFDIDLRVIPEESYGAALQYFTGSKEHNIALRKIAVEKGMKVNEYGVFKKEKMLEGGSEKGIYEILGMKWIPPELREDKGEIEASLEGKLPDILDYKGIRGDLHCHTDWSGGENGIEEIARAAELMGYEYIGIADHTKALKIENGLDEKELLEQRKEIDKIRTKRKLKVEILQGCEANILKDGSIDIEKEVLRELDFVIAGVHSHFKMEEKEMTRRMMKAMENPYVDIISHPTGRLIGMRDTYNIDLEEILRSARETGTVLEINAYPLRLDLSDVNIKKAKEAGVKMIINTDAHQKEQMEFMELGISQARRGWAGKEDIVNTEKKDNFLKALKRRKLKQDS